MNDDEPSNHIGVFVELGYTAAVQVDDDKRILFYPDGRVAFEHICDRSHRDAGIIRCAPLLQTGAGHTIVQRDPLTIEPSLLCDDCSTHGFVRNGKWVAS